MAKDDKTTQARVLLDSTYGKANDVVTVDAATLKVGKAEGALDDAEESVAYALTLPQNQEATQTQ